MSKISKQTVKGLSLHCRILCMVKATLVLSMQRRERLPAMMTKSQQQILTSRYWRGSLAGQSAQAVCTCRVSLFAIKSLADLILLCDLRQPKKGENARKWPLDTSLQGTDSASSCIMTSQPGSSFDEDAYISRNILGSSKMP